LPHRKRLCILSNPVFKQPKPIPFENAENGKLSKFNAPESTLSKQEKYMFKGLKIVHVQAQMSMIRYARAMPSPTCLLQRSK
jgi:hypothetical protein